MIKSIIKKLRESYVIRTQPRYNIVLDVASKDISIMSFPEYVEWSLPHATVNVNTSYYDKNFIYNSNCEQQKLYLATIKHSFFHLFGAFIEHLCNITTQRNFQLKTRQKRKLIESVHRKCSKCN